MFDRDHLPARSTLSRFLTALTQEPVEALRSLFLTDLLSRPLSKERATGDLVDREGSTRVVFDIDGTREAARQRALPQTEDLPAAYRRLDVVCAPGYTGRKRGEVVRTRTVVSQAHSYQWLGSFGNRGNGLYRKELRQALAAIGRYLATHQLQQERSLIRLDGQYGTGAVLTAPFWVRVCDPWQRLHRTGSSSCAGAAAPAPRSVPTAPRKPDGAQPLRLPREFRWDPRVCSAV